MNSVLEVNDLTVELRGRQGAVTALDKVSLTLNAGETLAVVGESGCGKSLTALALMRLLPTPPARICGGEIWFERQNLATLPEGRMRRLRGNRVAMIFQDPMSSLNPVKTVGDQLSEVLRVHLGLTRRQAWKQGIALLERVHIPDPARRMDEYPHRLSGGMSQRVMIAMAIACKPAVLIADEPTTALDVTIQAQILALLRELQADTGMALMLITHDLGVVAAMARRVAVMYAGKIVEQASVPELFDTPLHPYTQGLLRATPTSGRPGERLLDIPGRVPALSALPKGCAFAARCRHAMPACAQQRPDLSELRREHHVACLAAEEDARAPAPRLANGGWRG
ncbi:ABC transporter ATP-binding protein [Acerihabitans arboris]|uniref:ABC-type dipeptide transporter n=1 Tax=Acerihabitans arboris TaxID=2691583 RepID=A0A845SFF5_9GAMM|nr:ABC transporter ATP-binding protein [Acerihabitans arboris]NDL61674.1 ATP-binding cassette domain-containing protein [Acerihabitans arboris]